MFEKEMRENKLPYEHKSILSLMHCTLYSETKPMKKLSLDEHLWLHKVCSYVALRNTSKPNKLSNSSKNNKQKE